MRWKRGVTVCLGVVLVTTVSAAGVYTKPTFDEANCEEALECHQCSDQEKQEVRECAVTGKIQTLSCPVDQARDGTWSRGDWMNVMP